MKKRKRRNFKRFIAAFLVLALIISLVPADVLAKTTEEENGNRIAADDPEETLQKEQSEEAVPFDPKDINKEGEITSERTENTKLYYEGDGVYKQEVYLDPIHTKETPDADWEDISPELKESTSKQVQTENAILNSDFQKQMKNGLYATFEHNDHKVTYSLVEAKGPNKTSLTPKDTSADYKTDSNEIVYPDVFPNIDLQTFTFNENIKEDLVLHQYDGYNTFTFQLKTDLQAKEKEDGSIDFSDEKGKVVFSVPKPFMTDSKLDELSGEVERSDKVSYKLEKNEEGYLLHLTADENWLKDPERVYPVSIDPSTSLSVSSDTFVMSAYPTTNYSASSQKC